MLQRGISVSTYVYVNNCTMYITLELTESNSELVLTYIQRSGLWSRLYIQDPHYHCCLVQCEDSRATWLALLVG